MDIYEALTRDHDEVSVLFETLFDTDSAAVRKRRDAFVQLSRALKAHSSAERTLLFPLLEHHEQTHDLVEHAADRYSRMDKLLHEMSSMNHQGEEWMNKCRALHKDVEAHVDEEENRIFPQARHILSEEQARQLGARIGTEKAHRIKHATRTKMAYR
ncbi:MAG TPA: hemerythrin domain-containing protein [Gammaproteobacteria bacterium]|nr:hemerythrin domain-containing protein [Gammaproteobacteria bacterium]